MRSLLAIGLAAAVLAASLLNPLQASAQSFQQVDEVDLATIDPATNNGRLGRHVAYADAGRRLLVAAPFKLDPSVSGSQNGSVYSFNVLADGSLQFAQAIEPGARNQFGTALAAQGEWAAIAESGDKVHLYRWSGSQWQPSQLLRINPDVPAQTGITVRRLDAAAAISGDLLAIGDTSANLQVNGSSFSSAGAVVLFRRGADSVWRHEATLIAPTPSGSAAFGDALALSGDTLLVGAPQDKVDGRSVGGAYVFQRSGGGWSHVRTLRNPDTSQTVAYGWSVALDGGLAIVGCATCLTLPLPSDPTNTGAFFAYERVLGGANAWGLRGEYASSTPDFIDNFSVSLKLRGETLLVGATGSKRATFFARASDGEWQQIEQLVSDEVAQARTTNFGSSVDFFGGRAAVGADAWPDTSTSARWGEVSSWFNATIDACGGRVGALFCNGFEGQQ